MHATVRRALRAAALSLAALAIQPACLAGTDATAIAAPLARAAATRHEATIRGEVIRYTATVREFPVADPGGLAGAYVITIAYLRDDVRDRRQRPVIFAFNGGPGASSSPLHMKALGPVMRAKRSADDDEETSLVANEWSPLDIADLVFIDPVSTGFSRPFPGVDPRPWYDDWFDAQTVADVIAQWLHANDRESSPRFLMGESYGAIRAGLIVTRVPDLRFDGVLLVSGPGTPLDAPPDLQVIGSVASMAAGAWYHGRVDRRGLSAAEFFNEAAAFARGPYALALAAGPALEAAEKRRVAAQLASFIGLPEALILENDLRVDANTYMFNLLKDRRLRTGRLDVRVTSPLVHGQEGAIDDPALGVVPQGQSGPPPTPANLGPLPSPVVGGYVTRQLGFPGGDEPYIGVNFLANSKWTFHPGGGTEESLALAMKRDPALRLFVTAGYFDFGATDGRGYLDAGVPEGRFTFLPLAGPHEVYSGDANRAAFAAAVRDFVAGSPAE